MLPEASMVLRFDSLHFFVLPSFQRHTSRESSQLQYTRRNISLVLLAHPPSHIPEPGCKKHKIQIEQIFSVDVNERNFLSETKLSLKSQTTTIYQLCSKNDKNVCAHFFVVFDGGNV